MIGILTHHNRSTSSGCCNGIGAISAPMSTSIQQTGFPVDVHRDEDETHHHSETKAGNGHDMEVTLLQCVSLEIQILRPIITHTLNSCFLPMRRMSAESAACILPNAVSLSPSLLGLWDVQPLPLECNSIVSILVASNDYRVLDAKSRIDHDRQATVAKTFIPSR